MAAALFVLESHSKFLWKESTGLRYECLGLGSSMSETSRTEYPPVVYHPLNSWPIHSNPFSQSPSHYSRLACLFAWGLRQRSPWFGKALWVLGLLPHPKTLPSRLGGCKPLTIRHWGWGHLCGPLLECPTAPRPAVLRTTPLEGVGDTAC